MCSSSNSVDINGSDSAITSATLLSLSRLEEHIFLFFSYTGERVIAETSEENRLVIIRLVRNIVEAKGEIYEMKE